MTPDIIIIDNFFEDTKSLDKFKNILEDIPPEGRWYSTDTPEEYTGYILNKASEYYNMDKIIGYEVWVHKNTKPLADYEGGWHFDKDEHRYSVNKLLRFPICSCVFYLEIQNLQGGRLIVEDVEIIPKINRLVLFGPAKRHYVEDFIGERCSININPWNRKLEEYT
jgi:hypothetical protein